jgi:hypothetical protein
VAAHRLDAHRLGGIDFDADGALAATAAFVTLPNVALASMPALAATGGGVAVAAGADAHVLANGSTAVVASGAPATRCSLPARWAASPSRRRRRACSCCVGLRAATASP